MAWEAVSKRVRCRLLTALTAGAVSSLASAGTNIISIALKKRLVWYTYQCDLNFIEAQGAEPPTCMLPQGLGPKEMRAAP